MNGSGGDSNGLTQTVASEQDLPQPATASIILSIPHWVRFKNGSAAMSQALVQAYLNLCGLQGKDHRALHLGDGFERTNHCHHSSTAGDQLLFGSVSRLTHAEVLLGITPIEHRIGNEL